MGRPAVREAMQATGFLEVRHGEQPRVAEPTMAGALDRIGLTARHALSHPGPRPEDLEEARCATEGSTEGYLARIATRRRRSEDLAMLRAVVAEQEIAAGRDARTFTRRDGPFHAAVAGISGDSVFRSVVEAVLDWRSEFHASAVHGPGLEVLRAGQDADLASGEGGSDPIVGTDLFQSAPAERNIVPTEHLKANRADPFGVGFGTALTCRTR